MAQQKRTLKIDKRYTPKQREAIADEVVRYIRKRSEAGKGPDNKKWPGSYSKAYKESKDFKIAGKSGTINQRLSGDMLFSMEHLKDRSGSITYGFDAGDKENNGKAEGNIKGTYGQKSPIAGKKRDFLTITEKEQRKILKKFPIGVGLAAIIAAREAARKAAEEVAEGVELERPDA